LNGKVTAARDFLDDLVNELFPDPIVSVLGSHYVDVSLNRIGGKLAVNLVNTAGPHDNPTVYVHDEIPALGPLKVSVRLDKKPAKVSFEPSGKKIVMEYKNGILSIIVPRLELHEVLVIEK
jgi:hypothetical protein